MSKVKSTFQNEKILGLAELCQIKFNRVLNIC